MDAELYERARATIARDHGLSDKDAHRLVGQTAAELHADAVAMAKEVGAFDPTQRARDEAGRFASSGDKAESARMNEAIRAARGTSDDKADGSRMNELIRAATGRTS